MSNFNKDFLQHAVDKKENNSEKTIGQILDTLNEEQRNVVDYLIYRALEMKDKPAKKE